MHRLIDPMFKDVHENSIAYLEASNDCHSDSLNEEEGVESHCPSGPDNVLVTFTDVVYDGTITPIGLYKDFQIVSNVEKIGGSFDSCELKPEWNAY